MRQIMLAIKISFSCLICLLSIILWVPDCMAFTTFTGTMDAAQLLDSEVYSYDVAHSGKLVLMLEKDETLTEVTINISILNQTIVSDVLKTSQSSIILDIPEEMVTSSGVVSYQIEIRAHSGSGHYNLIIAEPNEVIAYELLNNLVLFDYEKASTDDQPLHLTWKTLEMEEDMSTVELTILDYDQKAEIENGIIRDKSGSITLPANLPVGKYTIIAEKKSGNPSQKLTIYAVGANNPKSIVNSNGKQLLLLNASQRSANLTPFSSPTLPGITMDGFIEGTLETGQIYEYEIALTGLELNLWMMGDQTSDDPQKPCLKAVLTTQNGETILPSIALGPNLIYFPIRQRTGNYRLRIESGTSTNYAFGVEYADAYAPAILTNCKLSQIVNANEEYTYDVDFASDILTNLTVTITNPLLTVSSFQIGQADGIQTPVTGTLQPGETREYTINYDTANAGVTVKGIQGQIIGDFLLNQASIIKQDEKEKNNTMNQANMLQDNVPTEGTISAKNDVDYYSFGLEWTSSVYVKLKNIPAGTNYDLVLYQMTGQSQLVEKKRCNNGAGKDEEIAMILNPGIYFLKIYSISGVSAKKYQIGFANIYSESRFAVTAPNIQKEVKDVHPNESIYAILYSKSDVYASAATVEYAKRNKIPLPLPTGGPIVSSLNSSNPSSYQVYSHFATESELESIDRYQQMRRIEELVEKYHELHKQGDYKKEVSIQESVTKVSSTTLTKFRLEKANCEISAEARNAIREEDKNSVLHTVYGRLAASGDHCYVYIDDNFTKTKAREQNRSYDYIKTQEDEAAKRIMQEFETHYTNVTSWFGEDPVVDRERYVFTDNKTYILLTPLIPAGFFWAVNMLEEPGYLDKVPSGWTLQEFQRYQEEFSKLDQNNNHIIDMETEWRSNRKKIVFVNEEMRIQEQIGTLIHEFQHLLYYHKCTVNHRNSGAETWWNEALSCFVKDLVGYGYAQGVTYVDCVRYFVENPNLTPVRNWAQGANNYGASYLFARYIYERYGMSKLSQICKSKNNPVQAIEEVTGKTFATVYSDWLELLLIKQLRNESIFYGNDKFFDETNQYKLHRERLHIQPENKIFNWAGWGPIFVKMNPVKELTDQTISITLPMEYSSIYQTNFSGTIIRWKNKLNIL